MVFPAVDGTKTCYAYALDHLDRVKKTGFIKFGLLVNSISSLLKWLSYAMDSMGEARVSFEKTNAQSMISPLLRKYAVRLESISSVNMLSFSNGTAIRRCNEVSAR